MKKGNVQQAFTVISSVIIMGILLIFGTRAISQLIDSKDRIEDAEFRNELTREIDQIKSKYGSVKYSDLSGLQRYSEMCVFDLERNWDTPHNCHILDKVPLTLGHLQDGTGNIFLYNRDSLEQTFLVDDLVINNNDGCECTTISSNGLVKIKLEGLGRSARFSFVE